MLEVFKVTIYVTIIIAYFYVLAVVIATLIRGSKR